MFWLPIALTSYLIAALNSLIDKYVLKAREATPLVYTFYVGIFSIFSIVFAGLDEWIWPGWEAATFDFLVGTVFLAALFFFFSALRVDEPSRTVSIVGAATPVVIVVASLFLGAPPLIPIEYQALGLLLLGGILISFRAHEESKQRRIRIPWYPVFFAITAAIFFAGYFLLAEEAFTTQPFVPAFVLTRIGSFLAALLLLLVPMFYRDIVSAGKTAGKTKIGALFVANKALAGIGFFLLNLAIARAGSVGINVAFVNALEATKYAFLFILVLLCTKCWPHLIEEHFTVREIIRKTFSILAIAAGTVILSLAAVL